MLPEFPKPPKSVHHDLLIEISRECLGSHDARLVTVPMLVWDKIIAALNGEHVKSLQRQALDAETDARAAGERPITGPWATVSRGDEGRS